MAELIAGVGVVEVAPDTCHVRWDLEVTVLFGCDLEERETETSQTWGRFAVWLKGGQIWDSQTPVCITPPCNPLLEWLPPPRPWELVPLP